jgi:Uma2 family endonuclease
MSNEDGIVVLRDLGWSDWRRHLEVRGDGAGPRMAYLDGAIEFMSPSRDHERLASFIGTLIETWALEVGVDIVPLGSWTLEDEGEESGAEPDECYQIGPVGKDRPDLAIEVIWTSGRLSKLEIYRRLGVGEVWVWRRGALRVFVLRDGAYVEIDRSEVFPTLDLQLLLSLLDRPTVTQAQRELLAALRARASSGDGTTR